MNFMRDVLDDPMVFLCKLRVFLARKLNRLVLGPLVGKLPCRSVRSLEEIYYRRHIRDHIADIIRIGDPMIVKYNFPDTYPPQFCKERAFEKRDVFILKDVSVSPKSGLVWFPEGYVLEESVGSFKRIMYGWDGVLHDPLLSVKSIATVYPIVTCPPTGYFHWLLERMPVLLQALSLVPSAQILIPKRSPPYLLNALELLLGTQDLQKRLIVATNPVSVARLVMPRLEVYSGFVHPQDIQLLRSAIKTKVAVESTASDGFLYVSRSKARKRRLANEQTLEEKLSAVGFSIVHPEEMSFQDQIAVFSRARFVVAPHGAGLSNIVWADPPCRILEIFPSDISNDCYARLAVSLGLGYDYVVCEPDNSSSGRIRIPDVLEKVTTGVAGKNRLGHDNSLETLNGSTASRIQRPA